MADFPGYQGLDTSLDVTVRRRLMESIENCKPLDKEELARTLLYVVSNESKEPGGKKKKRKKNERRGADIKSVCVINYYFRHI